MKIIRVSNDDDEGHRGNQRVIKDSLTLDEAEKLAGEMNDDPKRSNDDWFRVVPDNELLFVFEP